MSFRLVHLPDIAGFVAELGILYAKYRPEKLMEHLKLFSTRINIPRLIRVAEEYAHWKELVFLYVQVTDSAPPHDLVFASAHRLGRSSCRGDGGYPYFALTSDMYC